MDYPLHTQLASRLQHVEGALDVGVDVGVGGMVRVGYGDEGSQMQHSIAALHRLLHAVWVADVAGEYIQLVADFLRRTVQPAPGVEGVVEYEGTYFVALT
jgi:hypothetical protein